MSERMETRQQPVRTSDRVSDVLARDARLVEVFARQSPHFAALRRPGMRRVMARLVTVEQAARIGGVPAAALVHELNRALGIDAPTEDAAVGSAPVTGGAQPALPPGVCTVELDVRDDLRQGREPFSRIMAAVGALGGDEALCLRATFEPVPLFAVMGRRGFEHLSEQLGANDWRVWFYRSDRGALPNEPMPDVPRAELEATDVDADVVLDVRGLEPPEPMQRTLEALEQLRDGAVLVQVNVRVPHFLLPILTERGFDYEIFQPNLGRVVVRIARASRPAPTRHTPGG